MKILVSLLCLVSGVSLATDAGDVQGPSKEVIIATNQMGNVIVRRTVKFKNPSAREIAIRQVQVSCPCLQTTLSSQLIPANGGEVALQLNMEITDRVAEKSSTVLIEFGDKSRGLFKVFGRKQHLARIFPLLPQYEFDLSVGRPVLDLNLMFLADQEQPPAVEIHGTLGKGGTAEVQIGAATKVGSATWVAPLRLTLPKFEQAMEDLLTVDVVCNETKLGKVDMRINVGERLIWPNSLFFASGESLSKATLSSSVPGLQIKSATIVSQENRMPLPFEQREGDVEFALPSALGKEPGPGVHHAEILMTNGFRQNLTIVVGE